MPGYHNHRTSNTWNHTYLLYRNVLDKSYYGDECKEIRMRLNTSTKARGVAALMVNIYTNYCEQSDILLSN